MSGVIDDNGQQWEHCNACYKYVRIDRLMYEPPSSEHEYGRDLCPQCAKHVENAMGTMQQLQTTGDSKMQSKIKLHPSITIDRLMQLSGENENDLGTNGICTVCGEEQSGVEPDARGYGCESCGAPTVYGVEELLMHMI